MLFSETLVCFKKLYQDTCNLRR